MYPSTKVDGPPYPPPPGYQPPAFQPPGVVMAQPGAMYPSATTTTYMPPPAPMPGPFSALGYLESVDQLIVKQEIHVADVIFDFKTNVRFDVLNSQGQKVFGVAEENDCCTRNCCGSIRPFEMNIRDLQGNVLIRMHRPLKCCGCCFPCCCLQELTVECPPGQVIGKVKENWNIFTPTFTIVDGTENELFNITGSCCPTCSICYCGRDIQFDVIGATSGTPIGLISKQWSGILQEAFTNATNFGVSFPINLPVPHKALLLSVAFLINFMYFEVEPVQHQNSNSDN